MDRSRSKDQIALLAFLILFVLAYLSTATAWYAQRRPEYSHLRHTISELGEQGSADERSVSYLVFLPVGLACLLVAWLSRTSHPGAPGLLVAVGAAYSLSALFPCDPGTPLAGTWKNSIHNLAGGIAYAAIAYQLNDLADGPMGNYFQFTLWLLGAFLIAFVAGWPRQRIGLLQRLAEASILIGIVLLLWQSPSP